jgi:glycosyltransferase involved in cell wall biosynthesis
MSLKQLTIVGPLPPPAGGMANQTAKLAELLRGEGLRVNVIQTNPAYQPAWVGKLPVLRAGVRLWQFFRTLQRELTPQVQLIHLMANSGWSWHLFAAPVIWVARRKNIPVVLNYRGGYADAFFAKSWSRVEASLRHCAVILVPSTFLQQVFARYGKDSVIVQNVLDTALFVPVATTSRDADAPHVVVTRNLEAIYDVASCIRAFAVIQQQFPAARLSVAGTGPELAALQQLVSELQLKNINFVGRLTPQQVAALYQDADLMLNGSLVDNTPNSLIEAMASGVPVVSTDSGGIPQLVTHQKDALLVPAGQPDELASAALRVLQDAVLRQGLIEAGLANAARFSWHKVWELLQQQYSQVLARSTH